MIFDLMLKEFVIKIYLPKQIEKFFDFLSREKVSFMTEMN